MATYRRANQPNEYSQARLEQELNRIEQALENQDIVRLTELHAEPIRPRLGMVVLADGSDWDPGSGAGFYGYYGGVWVKLG